MITTSKAKLLCLVASLVWALPLTAEQPPRAEILTAHRIGTTPLMANYLATHHPAPNAPFRVFPLRKPGSHPGKGGGGTGGGSSWSDPALQSSPLTTKNVYPGAEFPGISADGYVPPDTNLSVGDTQIVETVNVNYAVYDKGGNPLQGPTPIHAIFAAASDLPSNDVCTSVDGGDPIVLYDRIDQRWIISQLAYNISFTNNHLCMAISKTDDATGAYTAYDISFGKVLPDYPKLAIWAAGTWDNSSPQAGVYFSANMFNHGSSFIGAQMCGFPLQDATSLPATIPWVCAQNGTSVASILPADLDGSPYATSGTTSPAPTGTAEYYLQFSGSKALSLYQFAPNFSAGTYTITGPTNLGVDPFYEACGGGACVPQLGTSTQLDSLGDRLMYRLSYRNYGIGGQSMVVTHSVQDGSASSQTGVRWYQLTNTSDAWKVAQQGTYGINDGDYRWMGSIAQDKAGDLGLGYSISSPNIYPNIAYTGRVPGDTSNKMEGEQFLNIGAGAQTSVNRWGDYSSMSVDPSDDCTFWYANEYLKSNGSYTNWGTYINNFKVYAPGSPCQ
ncbi:MAG: hypothetical protein M1423_05375 [Acidobacteria bacterium]|nr:hypothetical protein [Acidobacteriota bacterium]